MQTAQFEHAIENILRRDRRFDPQAYLFLKDSLDFTLKRASEGNGGQPRHVSGKELLIGFRDLALQEFGPMAGTLMSEWGLQDTRNVGEMVFLLIDEQMFGKQDSDTLEDFEDIYDFHEAFTLPFTPKSRLETSDRN
ncbi:Verrucomicrobia/planctomycetes-restricted protein [Haloferula helveola]|uniref:Verrucomicrobia/planctomycetes-restricted protein n=1 Tax=Haloferula helveola TaxID=490095 RepID=A0ABN6H9L0_9BACT|nr:Verrucomicrobia/planctomycetes-restricted protein [Haloferula helveola]